MASHAKSGVARVARYGFACAVLLAAAAGEGKPTVSVAQLNERHPGDYAPALDGEVVSVQGTVSTPVILYPLFAHLPIQDETGRGILLEGNASQFSRFQPGMRVEAKGTVSKRAGTPVVLVSQVDLLSRGTAPSPQKLALADMHSFRYLGTLVAVEGRVVDKGENTSGDYLMVGDAKKPLRILMPRGTGRASSLDRFDTGDWIHANGIASQYCPLPPYNRSFQLVLASDDDILLVNKRWLVSPEWIAVLGAFLAFALGLWWIRERRMAAQRNMVRTFYALGEEVIGVASPVEILNRLAASVPGMLGISGVHLYVFNRGTKELDRVRPSAETPAFSIPVQAPEGALPLGAAVSFRNQALLTILDTRRSPFFPDGRTELQPGSLMFVPMFAESEVLGVFELYDAKPDHEFSRDERILTQHLANQIGIALRMLEEKSVREQLYRSEKLAAVGQLISGIAAELKSPLDSISSLADNIVNAPPGTLWTDMRAISSEARKASDIVARLVSFMQPDRAEPKRIELNGLIASLIDFRRQEWQTRGVEIKEMLSPSPIHILGSQGQLERVFLDLLVQAEHAITESTDKRLVIATSILARRAVVEIEYAVRAAKPAWDGYGKPDPNLLADGVARGIVHSHGGELRASNLPGGTCRLELDFPMAPERVAESGGVTRAFTCLVVEPDENNRENLVRMLTQRGCRVIPATSGEEGAERVQRLRFDVVFCSVRLPGLNWIELAEGMRTEIGGFVLLTEGFDYELSRGLLNADNYLLSKPVVEEELDQVLAAVETRLSSPEARLLVIRPTDRKASNLY